MSIEAMKLRESGRERTILHMNGGKTGYPPGLLQDDCHKLFRWFAARIDARWALRRALGIKENT